MSDNCCCSGGRCRPPLPPELTRRQFIRSVAVGAAGVAVGGELLLAQSTVVALTEPKLPASWRYPLTPPRVYKDGHLDAVAMPIGGIGTGTVWLDGQGRLSIWQIFNNFTEKRIPESFFAVRVKPAGQPATVRVLQTVAEEPLAPMASLTYEGGYPIARLDFAEPALPVALRMEAFNPLIPTDAGNSAIPCAIFRLTARNTGTAAADVSFIATCQNAIGQRPGRNRNRAVREPGMVAVAMEQAISSVPTCAVKVRARSGTVVPGPELHWFAELPTLAPAAVEPFTRIANAGGVAVAAAVAPAFFAQVAALRGNPDELNRQFTVFEDFEKETYEGWTVTGTAFGKGPSTGSHPGQQKVSGFIGKRLVNTFLPNDKPHGTLTSKSFTIAHRYIGFLIGGGAHKNETCMNLLVGGKVVRTATGRDREQLEPASWDVNSRARKRSLKLWIATRKAGATSTWTRSSSRTFRRKRC